MDSRYAVGSLCHWCGKEVTHRHSLRAGKHLFCPGNVCKMAHHRAFNRWEKNRKRAVTAIAGVPARPGSDRAAGGNGKKSRPRPPSSSGSGSSKKPKGNRRKGAK